MLCDVIQSKKRLIELFFFEFLSRYWIFGFFLFAVVSWKPHLVCHFSLDTFCLCLIPDSFLGSPWFHLWYRCCISKSVFCLHSFLVCLHPLWLILVLLLVCPLCSCLCSLWLSSSLVFIFFFSFFLGFSFAYLFVACIQFLGFSALLIMFTFCFFLNCLLQCPAFGSFFWQTIAIWWLEQ